MILGVFPNLIDSVKCIVSAESPGLLGPREAGGILTCCLVFVCFCHPLKEKCQLWDKECRPCHVHRDWWDVAVLH